MSATQVEPPFWRKNWVMRNTLFSSYHISERNLGAYVDELKKIEPVFIDSYPSAIFSIGKFLLDRGIEAGIAPKAIITSSETLLDNQREVIEKAFHSRVFDQYGSAEMVGFINQCEKGSYHINPEYGIVEIIKEDGEPAKDGEPGELVCTGFVNSTMPLIRYKTGDSAIACEDMMPLWEGISCGEVNPRSDGRLHCDSRWEIYRSAGPGVQEPLVWNQGSADHSRGLRSYCREDRCE